MDHEQGYAVRVYCPICQKYQDATPRLGDNGLEIDDHDLVQGTQVSVSAANLAHWPGAFGDLAAPGLVRHEVRMPCPGSGAIARMAALGVST